MQTPPTICCDLCFHQFQKIHFLSVSTIIPSLIWSTTSLNRHKELFSFLPCKERHNIAVPSRTITYPLGDVHFSWQDRFCGTFGAGCGHADPSSQAGIGGVCQTSCPPISCGVSDFRGAGFAFRVQPDGSGPLCQGSCPLLYFSSISQVGGIGR